MKKAIRGLMAILMVALMMAPANAEKFLKGDINRDGVVDIRDVVLLSRIASGMDSPPSDLSCIDLNRDGVIDITDVDLAAKIALGELDLGTCKAGQPDLVVDIDTTYNGGFITVTGVVKNQGKADVRSPLAVELEIETPSGFSYSTASGSAHAVIRPGETRDFSFRFFAPQKGVYKLRAIVDPADIIEESSENNNQKTRAVNAR